MAPFIYLQMHQCYIQCQVNMTHTHHALQQHAFILFYELCSDSEVIESAAIETNDVSLDDNNQ